MEEGRWRLRKGKREKKGRRDNGNEEMMEEKERIRIFTSSSESFSKSSLNCFFSMFETIVSRFFFITSSN